MGRMPQVERSNLVRHGFLFFLSFFFSGGGGRRGERHDIRVSVLGTRVYVGWMVWVWCVLSFLYSSARAKPVPIVSYLTYIT